MKRLNKRVVIDPRFSWIDWSLYDGPGAVPTAMDLNRKLAELVNNGHDRREVEAEMSELMANRSLMGANDTEPRAFLSKILEEVYD